MKERPFEIKKREERVKISVDGIDYAILTGMNAGSQCRRAVVSVSHLLSVSFCFSLEPVLRIMTKMSNFSFVSDEGSEEQIFIRI